jgi:hypothetical protein
MDRYAPQPCMFAVLDQMRGGVVVASSVRMVAAPAGG